MRLAMIVEVDLTVLQLEKKNYFLG